MRGPRAQPKSQQIAGTLARSILSGELQPGERVTCEIAARRSFDVSRTTYREALRVLAAKGLVDSRPRHGTQVTEPERWHLLDPQMLAWMLASNGDLRNEKAFIEFCAIIEPAAAALAATRCDSAHVSELRTHCLAMQRTPGLVGGREDAVADFMRTLGAASGNQFLAFLTRSIAQALSHHRSQNEVVVKRFRKLLSAIEKSEPRKAHSAMMRIVIQRKLDR